MNNTKRVMYNITLIAIFSALSFVGTMIRIPVGISKMHLGNFVCILASLLCGGFVGGISGSLGMGLNDILLGDGYGPDTILRTFIVKFLMGLIVGILFKYLVKNRKKPNAIYYSGISLFSITFILFLVLYILHGESFTFLGKTFKNSLFLVISLGVIDVFFILMLIFSKKLREIEQYVLLSTSVGLILNIVLEFVLKVPLKMLFASMTFNQALIYAMTSLPAALLTSILTIVMVTLIYYPMYFATAKINKLNSLYEDIKEITTWDRKKKEE